MAKENRRRVSLLNMTANVRIPGPESGTTQLFSEQKGFQIWHYFEQHRFQIIRTIGAGESKKTCDAWLSENSSQLGTWVYAPNEPEAVASDAK